MSRLREATHMYRLCYDRVTELIRWYICSGDSLRLMVVYGDSKNEFFRFKVEVRFWKIWCKVQ